MAAGNSGNLRNLINLSVNGQRSRRNDASEILVDCIEPECNMKSDCQTLQCEAYS